MLRSVLAHRSLIADFVRRDFKTRFAGSVLGIVWNVIHPLVMILIYALVFSQVMRAKLPGSASAWSYSIFLCSGIIPWVLFNDLLMRYTGLFFEHANLIKKVSFPREILHASAMITGSINFIISFTIFAVLLAILHVIGSHPVNIPFFSLILFLLTLVLQQVFCLGIGLAASVLNVFFRDVAQLVTIVVQLWFWFTPIVYVETVVPDALKSFLRINPMYHFMEIYRSILYLNTVPSVWTFFIVCVISFASLGVGYTIYRRLVEDVADEI